MEPMAVLETDKAEMWRLLYPESLANRSSPGASMALKPAERSAILRSTNTSLDSS
ncbi:hypothetical protein PtB15_2B136 [Puccinia triticina]|nr:hypothetical protein PtB15_2B136 [Puccinia triticina]